MAFDVIFQPRAEADVDVVVAWLTRKKNPAAAARFRSGVFGSVVKQLERDPHSYPEAEEAADLGIDLRVLLHGRRRHVYRVLFTIDGQTVNVLRIRHAAQDRLQPGDV